MHFIDKETEVCRRVKKNGRAPCIPVVSANTCSISSSHCSVLLVFYCFNLLLLIK